MLLADFINRAIKSLENLYPSPEARGLVLYLCEEKLGVKSYTHIVEPGTVIPCGLLPCLEECLGRLCSGEPIQYVLGYAFFCGRRFNVCPSVLIPRPETEELVALALKAMPSPSRVLDLCTGSGCIAWSIGIERPDSQVLGLDISSDALLVARSQFSAENVAFSLVDVLNPEASKGFEPGFDLIVSNPPYILESEKSQMRSNVLDFEPGLALFVPDSDPLVFYRAVGSWAERLLRSGGVGIVEINENLSDETASLFTSFAKTEVKKDVFGKNRFVVFTKK